MKNLGGRKIYKLQEFRKRRMGDLTDRQINKTRLIEALGNSEKITIETNKYPRYHNGWVTEVGSEKYLFRDDENGNQVLEIDDIKNIRSSGRVK